MNFPSQTGPSVTPVMPQPPAAFDSPMCMQPSSSGTNTVGRTPQPRTTLFNMPTPDTPYGRLLNVASVSLTRIIARRKLFYF